MNDDLIFDYLRSRGQAEPPMDLVSSVTSAIDRSPQRRSWFAPFLPALAAAAAIAAVVVIVSFMGQDRPPSGSMPTPTLESSSDPSPSSSESAVPSVVPSLAATPTPEPIGAEVFADPDDCEDDSVGYRVAFPDAWWWNQAFDSAVGPRAACRYFAPAAFDVSTLSREQPIPDGVAIHVQLIPPNGGLGQLGEEVSSEELTVAGRPATRSEQVFTPGGFLAPDERVYQYVVELPGSRRLVFSTGNLVGDYDENRSVLDGMMQTLELFDPDDVCGAAGEHFVCGQIVLGLADGAGEPIEAVIERHGADPDTDILERREEIGAYVIAVPHGSEGDEISRYLTDGAIDSADLNRAE